MRAPRVFISYSHDSEAHKKQVRLVAERLRGLEVDVQLDQFEISPLQGWEQWMAQQIKSADFVIAVCTRTYRQCFEGDADCPKLGVPWEAKILMQDLYRARGNRKVIPVLLSREDPDSVPAVLGSSTRYKLYELDGFKGLYRHLTSQPATPPPPLGDRWNLPPEAQVLPGSGPLSQLLAPAERQRLVEALQAIPSLRDGQRVSELAAGLPGLSHLASEPGGGLTIEGLLEGSLARLGGIEALVDALLQVEDLAVLEGLADLLQRYFPMPVEWVELLHLKAALRDVQVPAERAALAYRKAALRPKALAGQAGEGGPVIYRYLNLLAWEPHSAPDRAPVLRLLVELERTVPRLLEGAVGRLMEEIAARRGIDLANLRAAAEASVARPAASFPTRVPALLQLLVTPCPWKSGLYTLKAWLGEAGTFHRLDVPDAPRSAEDLRLVTREAVIAALEERRNPFAEARLKVWLPIELLSADLDCWEIPIGRASCSTLGAHCEVVVRSYERLYDPACRTAFPAWKEKWENRPVHGPAHDEVFWAHTEADLDSRLFERLRQAGSIFAASRLAETPAVAAARLDKVLDAGIPIGLWGRRVLAATIDIEAQLREAICCAELDLLPRRLLARRKHACLARPPDTPWGDVTLLWDDPSRLPPGYSFQLQAPEGYPG